MWHPKDPRLFITSSADSTIRYVVYSLSIAILIFQASIWDIENKRKQKSVIVVKSKERGARTKVTACAYSQDASMIGGSAQSFPLLGHLLICRQRAWTEPCTYGKQAPILFGPICQSKALTSKGRRPGLLCSRSTGVLCSQGVEMTQSSVSF